MQTNANNISAPECDYLYVQTSQLPDSGKGLYTAIPIYKDEIISYFEGEILSAAEAIARVANHKDQYFINKLDGTILDCLLTACFAKYANDAKGPAISNFKNNAIISLDDNDEICLIASKNIKAGEEIFCGYGVKYWRNRYCESTY
jgi:uncharacterized protein